MAIYQHLFRNTLRQSLSQLIDTALYLAGITVYCPAVAELAKYIDAIRRPLLSNKSIAVRWSYRIGDTAVILL